MTNRSSEAGTLDGGDRLRLFLALPLPEDASRALAAWAKRHLAQGGRVLESLHVTLAFLGSRPRADLEPVVGCLREEAAVTAPFSLAPRRYRETRSVGMLVLDDPSGEATGLAERVQARLERLGVYDREARPWLPHTTVLRFRERPRLRPPPPELGPFAPSEAAAFLSRLRPGGAQYEVLESCPLGVEPGG